MHVRSNALTNSVPLQPSSNRSLGSRLRIATRPFSRSLSFCLPLPSRRWKKISCVTIGGLTLPQLDGLPLLETFRNVTLRTSLSTTVSPKSSMQRPHILSMFPGSASTSATSSGWRRMTLSLPILSSSALANRRVFVTSRRPILMGAPHSWYTHNISPATNFTSLYISPERPTSRSSRLSPVRALSSPLNRSLPSKATFSPRRPMPPSTPTLARSTSALRPRFRSVRTSSYSEGLRLGIPAGSTASSSLPESRPSS